MAYTVHQAKTHLSRLIKEAEAGQEVTLTRGATPVAKIIPIPQVPKGKRTLAGAYRGKISWTPDAFDPMTDEELIEWGLGYMLDAPLIPSPDESGE